MLYVLFGLILSLLSLLCLLLLFIGQRTSPRPSTKEEKFYFQLSESTEKLIPTYDISKDPLVDLSVVIPAFNEKERLPVMLEDAVNYLRSRRKQDPTFRFELIVVDDGSNDNTSECALQFAKEQKLLEEICVLKLSKNRGKGGAVAQGMLISKGKNILFADADGATQFKDISLLEKRLEEIQSGGLGLVAGSRSHLVKTEAVVKRSLLRNFLMYGFHTYLFLLGIRGIKDTQCGFKLFTRAAAHRIFYNLHTEGWIFDIEALILAKMLDVPISEVQVNWQEIEGSKVSIIKDAIKMALDLLMIRLSYFWGIWKIKVPVSNCCPSDFR